MCLQTSSIRPYQKWNWNGSEIVFDTSIPVSRKLTMGGKTITKFPVDIREFITIENNAVIKKALNKIISVLPSEEQVKFYKNEKSNFDFRVRKCQEYLKTIKYTDAKSNYDQWQFPEETLELKTGDCEDLAFLLASLILSCGISDYCVRVALGKVINYASPDKDQHWEHAWVMYQNENGVWEIIEPLLFARQAASSKPGTQQQVISSGQVDIEYLPHYVFNRHHLWRVRSFDTVTRKSFNNYLTSERNYFNKFNPGFAAQVHNTIFHDALKGMSWFDLQRVIATSLYIDVNTIAYDPRDHFDFAYIEKSWERINERLATKKLEDFALAIHTIGDFYAHTYYGYFAIDHVSKKIPVYNPGNPIIPSNLKYDFSTLGELPGCKLSKCKPGAKNAEELWSGKLISGQWYRWYASIPNDIQKHKDFCTRRCLPDHDSVAVDSEKFDPAKHKLFKTQTEYKIQFDARKTAATEHIKMVYKEWKKM
jgi:hypothetical protein